MLEKGSRRGFRMGLTSATLLGLGLGILTGLFFGEHAQSLEPVGNAYIRLLQMAVLPYFIVALVYGLGRLSFDEAKILGANAAILLLVLWLLCGVTVVALSLAFPEAVGATPFSASLVEKQQSIDFLSLYIPSNPFNSLANAIIPAVVVFGVAMGVSLIGIRQKQHLLDLLATVSDLLTRITQAMVKLTPIGVFALAASAAGTMSFEDATRLQVYLVLYGVGALALTFVVVPLLVSTLTPFTYREVLQASRDPLITGFTTANLLVVLPMLAANCKALFERGDFDNRRAESTVDVVIPLSFPFPDIGTLLILLFIPFAAWYSGNAMGPGEYPAFLAIGFFSFFGNIEIGMPFLLDQLRIPADMFQIHVMTLVYVGRFATMLAVMHVTSVALVTACAVNGMLQINLAKISRQLVVTLGALALAVIGPSLLFRYTFDPEYRGYEKFVERETLFENQIDRVHSQSLPEPHPPAQGRSRIDQIRERGIMRVGYFADALPYVFTNEAGRLVGYDVDMASLLARELDVQLEFVRIKNDSLEEMLSAGYCDLVMSKVFITTARLDSVTFSEPYIDETFAFLVEDHRRNEFNRHDRVQSMESPRIAVLDLPYMVEKLAQGVPRAEVHRVDSVRQFLRGDIDVDAMMYTAESGSAWTLIYPDYSVAIPQPNLVSIPVAYALPRGDSRMKAFVDGWLELKKKDLTTQRLYDYWILGNSGEERQLRWSVLRDVLGWID